MVNRDISLIICDTYGYLTNDSNVKTFENSEDRDRYIKEVQVKLSNSLKFLKRGDETGSAIVGADVFSMESLGEKVFGKGKDKRVLVWNRDLNKHTNRGYTNNRAYFMWGIIGKRWIHHLLEGETMFRGEFLQSKGCKTSLDLVRSIIRRFSNKGCKVMEITLHKDSVIQEAVNLEGREYVEYRECELNA